VKNSTKIISILLDTSLYTTEPIIVPSVQTEFRSRVVILPGELFDFLNSLEEEIKINSQQSKEYHYSFWRYLVALLSAIIYAAFKRRRK
jgi:hypothetical protein